MKTFDGRSLVDRNKDLGTFWGNKQEWEGGQEVDIARQFAISDYRLKAHGIPGWHKHELHTEPAANGLLRDLKGVLTLWLPLASTIQREPTKPVYFMLFFNTKKAGHAVAFKRSAQKKNSHDYAMIDANFFEIYHIPADKLVRLIKVHIDYAWLIPKDTEDESIGLYRYEECNLLAVTDVT